MKKYTVGFKVPSSNPYLHMTLCFVGRCHETKLDEIKKQMDVLRDILPLRVNYLDYDMFGPNKNIRVRKCEIVDQAKMAKVQAFYDKFYVPEENIPYNAVPQLHVTLKNADEEIKLQNHFVSRELFLKELGAHPPLFIVNAADSS